MYVHVCIVSLLYLGDRQWLLSEEKQVSDYSCNGFGAEPIYQ